MCFSVGGNFCPGPGGCSFSVCLSVFLFSFFVVSLLTSVTSVGVLGPCRKSTSPSSTAPNESAAFPRICVVYRVISQRRLGLGLGLSIVFFFVTYRLVGADTRTGIRGMRLPPFMPVPAHRPTVPPSHYPRALIADRLCPQPSGVHIGTQTLRVTYRIRPGPVPLIGNPNASPPRGYVATTYCIIHYSSPSHERTKKKQELNARGMYIIHHLSLKFTTRPAGVTANAISCGGGGGGGAIAIACYPHGHTEIWTSTSSESTII